MYSIMYSSNWVDYWPEEFAWLPQKGILLFNCFSQILKLKTSNLYKGIAAHRPCNICILLAGHRAALDAILAMVCAVFALNTRDLSYVHGFSAFEVNSVFNYSALRKYSPIQYSVLELLLKYTSQRRSFRYQCCLSSSRFSYNF